MIMPWGNLHCFSRQRKEASNTCHLTCLLHLMVNIHERFGDLRSKITFLQQLCSLHPYNHWHWMKLAESYMSLLEFLPAASSSLKQEHTAGQQPMTQTEDQQKKEKDCVWLKASMCFVRARWIFTRKHFRRTFMIAFGIILERKHSMVSLKVSLCLLIRCLLCVVFPGSSLVC